METLPDLSSAAQKRYDKLGAFKIDPEKYPEQKKFEEECKNHDWEQPIKIDLEGATYVGQWLGKKRHGFGIMVWYNG